MTDQDASVDDKVRNVLFLEDDHMLGPIIKREIERLGYNVDLATCIAEAKEYERMAQSPFHYSMAILDMGVPLEKGMIIDSYAGFDYAQELRQSDPGIRIAICTSQELLENQIKTLSAQGIIHIDKMRGHDTIIKFLKS